MNIRAIILIGPPTSYLGANLRKGTRSLMSRNSLISSRRTLALRERPATDTRLLPNPFPHPNTHYKRCPKAQRLSLGSDQSPPRPQYCLVPVTGNGRFLNSNRLALLRGQHRRISAPVPGRIYVAGIDLAGESEQPGDVRLQGFKPTQDSTVVTIGELQMLDDGFGSRLPALTVVEHHWWTGKPHTETFSGLVHLLKNVWGCRRVVVDATGIGAGVAAFLRKNIGPSIVVPFTFTAPTICTPTPIGNPSPGTGSRGGVLPPLPPRERAGVRVITSPACRAVITNQRPTHCHSDAPRGIWGGALPPLPSTKLGAGNCTKVQLPAPVFVSPSPLKALRACPESFQGERGTKGVRVPSPHPATREIPRILFRRRSIKTATSSINVQSNPQPLVEGENRSLPPRSRSRGFPLPALYTVKHKQALQSPHRPRSHVVEWPTDGSADCRYARNRRSQKWVSLTAR